MNKFALYFIFLLNIIINCCPSAIFACSMDFNNNYNDYLPRYRTLSKSFLISQIEYTTTTMILSLNYVAQEEEEIVFFGSQHPESWKIKTGNGSKAAEAYALLKTGSIKNIEVNKIKKIASLDDNAQKKLIIQKGDLLSCKLYFERLPQQVRIVHLIGGDKTKQGTARINCQDLQIKSQDNTALGSLNQMETNLERFYHNNGAVNFPTITSDLLVKQEERVEAVGVPMENPLEHSLKPINYMPKELQKIEDLGCNERLILSNIYFHDNKAEFSGRIKTMKTINMVVEYLRYHADMKIVLHGHTDIFGNAFKNLELSKKRVWAVKSAITNRGISAERIITVHHGGAQPLIQYKNGGEKNRRVEVEVLCVERSKQATEIE